MRSGIPSPGKMRDAPFELSQPRMPRADDQPSPPKGGRRERARKPATESCSRARSSYERTLPMILMDINAWIALRSIGSAPNVWFREADESPQLAHRGYPRTTRIAATASNRKAIRSAQDGTVPMRRKRTSGRAALGLRIGKPWGSPRDWPRRAVTEEACYQTLPGRLSRRVGLTVTVAGHGSGGPLGAYAASQQETWRRNYLRRCAYQVASRRRTAGAHSPAVR